jgi:chemotaxis protein MotB
MAKKKRGGAHGGHGWFVTFADLMALLMAFFVMVAAYSTQDKDKMLAVLGSMKEAFGTQRMSVNSGVIEIDGIPTKPSGVHRDMNATPEDASEIAGKRDPNEKAEGAALKRDRDFALAAASLRQALGELPEINEVSRHIIFEETDEGLNIQIVDQEGRAMFADGAREPYERTRRMLQKLATPLRQMGHRITITGHTSASRTAQRFGYGAWDLTADRANAVRRILEDEGVPSAQFYAVSGKADTQPLFADDPFMAANRRVTISLVKEAPPLPPGLKP